VKYRWFIALGIGFAVCRGTPATGQSAALPLLENFDTLVPPSLPDGWSASRARVPGGDFSSVEGGAASPPGALLSSNATVGQWFALPSLDLTDWRDLTIGWSERHSSTHNSSLAVESAAGPGEPFVLLPGGFFDPPASTAYVRRFLDLTGLPEGLPSFIIRWRVTGDGSGSSGTLRIDDLAVEGSPRWDLSVAILSPALRDPGDGGAALVSGRVLNEGFGESTPATISWYVKRRGILDEGEWEFRSSSAVEPLRSGDSLTVEFPFLAGGSGPVEILLVCDAERDLVRGNDSSVASVRPPAAAGSVVINEIMYDPLPGREEYVEILNVTTTEIDVGSWTVSDREDDSSPSPFPPGIPPLPPGGYLLCTPGTGLGAGYPGIPRGTQVVTGLRGLTLNNGGDLLILSDERGRIIDRVEFSPSWHTPAVEDPTGRSLEKIDPGSPGSES